MEASACAFSSSLRYSSSASSLVLSATGPIVLILIEFIFFRYASEDLTAANFFLSSVSAILSSSLDIAVMSSDNNLAASGLFDISIILVKCLLIFLPIRKVEKFSIHTVAVE